MPLGLVVETFSKRRNCKTGKMVIVKEILSDYKEDYQKALNLINKANDPPNEPYRSFYAAKELLLGIQENLENVLASILAAKAKDGKEAFTYKVLLAYVQSNLGYIYAKTEEPNLGEKYLRRCIELIEPHKMHPEAIIPYIGAISDLGKVLANARKYQQALEWLKLSEKVYHDFKASGNGVAISITDLFGTTPEEIEKGKGSDELEKLYIEFTYDLGRAYGNLKEWEKSATYYHKALGKLDSNSYEPMDFALIVANLSQCFLNQNKFKEARHHLAAATYIISKQEEKLITPEMSEATIEDLKETFKRRHADLARCWAKYGLALLKASKEHLFHNKDAKSLNDMIEKMTIVDSNEFRFPNWQLEVYEDRVTTDFCLNLDDAKLIFRFAVNWLDQAEAYYYELDIKPTEYAGIIIDYAELYENMAFFEKNPIDKVKMQKRCAKYYEKLIDVLNPTEYLGICRKCWYGAGIAYYTILVIFLHQKNRSRSHCEKINQVCQKAIKNFLELQKSYMENDCITFKSNLSTQEIHIVLHSQFNLGLLYCEMVPPDPALHLEILINSYKYMKRFTDGCDKYKEAAETLKKEIHISNEVVAVQLPVKIKICQAFIN